MLIFKSIFVDAQSYISGSHVPHEWLGDGHQGHTVLSVGPLDRRSVRYLGSQVFPISYSILHLYAHTVDVHKYVVVLCLDLN